VFCSERRTQRTADLLLGDRDIPASPSPRSMKCSSATGKCATIAIYSRKMPKTTPHGAPTGSMRRHNGESFQAFAERVRGFTATLSQFRQLDHLLIVGHQGVLSLLSRNF
jgi:alpha-ribazole phosphatase